MVFKRGFQHTLTTLATEVRSGCRAAERGSVGLEEGATAKQELKNAQGLGVMKKYGLCLRTCKH